MGRLGGLCPPAPTGETHHPNSGKSSSRWPGRCTKEPTAAEAKLWQRLRKEQIRGVKFRRQFAIDRFIADFCSPRIRLIIEVDGPTHQYSQEEDAIRQAFLESLGFVVVRFTNLDVLNDLSAVLDVIDRVVLTRLGLEQPHPNPPQLGEGTVTPRS
ncbi:MAG: endonuclease domain-containing protein [Caldilineaceae bacterium]